MRSRLGWLTLLLCAAAAPAAESPYLFVWAADADGEDSDFVAVLDARRDAAGYGAVLATVEVGLASGAHHSEHRMPADGRLFVNGFPTGTTFVVDLSAPLRPALVRTLEPGGELQYPHSFERLPNGNVLATFQNGTGGAETTGGLAELDATGEIVRSASAAVADRPTIRPYSVAVAPAIDRVISTTTDMRGEVGNDTVQIWRLSDLELLATVPLPRGPRGGENLHPVEARVLADGTVLVNTFGCGLYALAGLETSEPRARHVYSFEARRRDGQTAAVASFCALPVVMGDFWVQTVPALDGLAVVDTGDVSRIRQVSALSLGLDRFPHWIAAEPGGDRIVVTGFGELAGKVVMVTIDRSTGRLTIDRDFGEAGSVDFDRDAWPHGASGGALPHGTVFSDAP